MPDTFTTTSTQGFFSRLMNSFIGILLGPVIVIGAIILLSWNEGRAVQAIRGLDEAGGVTIEAPAAEVNPGNEGKLVHVTGQATAAGPIEDSDLGVSFADQVAVARKVEMYQWKEKKEEKEQENVGGSKTTTTTYTYSKEWSEGAIDSSQFQHPEGHENPQMPFTSTRMTASDAALGGFKLDSGTADKIDTSKPLKPEAPEGWVQNGNDLYKGENPSTPAIGDVRVQYAGLPSGSAVSVLARQTGEGFSAYTTTNGYTIHLATTGTVPAADMIKKQQEAEALITWILRGVGTFLIFIGFSMFFGPLAIIASILPFLATLVRGATGFFAFVLSIPVALITIAISWLAFRPLIGGGILLLGLGLGYLLWRWHHNRTA
ncbi:MAG: TMEM43 family protein, partial [Alphaproteobacteria bacterium]|nr:TMEM43 family protein [Alphaproteobacteria bacterium]